LLRSQPRPHRAKRGTEGRVGPCHRLGGLAQRRGAIDDFQCSRAAAGDVVMQGEPQPRAVLRSGTCSYPSKPRRGWSARWRPDTGDRDEIHAGEARRVRAGIGAGLMLRL
jgi:hypothetical protein